MADYNNSRPTDRAKMMFHAAETTSGLARTFVHDDDKDAMYKTMVADSLNALAQGLGDLATGLRATYILLDQVKRSSVK